MRELAVKIFLAPYITSANSIRTICSLCGKTGYGGKRGEDSSREREKEGWKR